MYWPNMSTRHTDIENFLQRCQICRACHLDQSKEPMISHDIPTRPWARVGCNLFEFNGNDYLICADYFSDFFEVDRIHGKTGKKVISKLKAQIVRQDIPDVIMTDNSPPFNSGEIMDFADKFEFKHRTSSQHYPQ